VAEDESILVESLVMSYKGVKLFSTVTPAALDLWGDAELGWWIFVCVQTIRVTTSLSGMR
jgi:hypothetical protein